MRARARRNRLLHVPSGIPRRSDISSMGATQLKEGRLESWSLTNEVFGLCRAKAPPS
jgi:hypothetical protein